MTLVRGSCGSLERPGKMIEGLSVCTMKSNNDNIIIKIIRRDGKGHRQDAKAQAEGRTDGRAGKQAGRQSCVRK